MVKYRTSWGEKIEPIRIARETPHFLVVLDEWMGKTKERKVAKSSSYETYHNTWEKARNYLLEKEKHALKSLRVRLEETEERIKKIEAMKP